MHEEHQHILRDVLTAGRCRRVTLSRPTLAGRALKATVRPVEVRGETVYQFAVREGTQERHENLPAEAALVRIAELFPRDFLDCRLFADDADVSFRTQPDGRIAVKRSPPSMAGVESSHDRVKRRLIPEGVPCPFLVEIGVMTPAGKVKADKQHKFRQINRFLEFVDDVLPHLPEEGPLHVVDFGCGKSSLTFAVHHLLAAVRGREVRITGLDRNPSVIETCRGIAGRLGGAGLRFELGDIAEHETSEKVHLAISLHACDTATDFALAKAIAWQADAILAAPCCQHELAPQLEHSDLAQLLRHGLLRERLASLVTDALRAECLEISGYRTQVIEFIDLEHTPKNVLLRSVRRGAAPEEAEARRRSLTRTMQALGITGFTLERLLRPTSVGL